MKLFLFKTKQLFSNVSFIALIYGILIGFFITFNQHQRYVQSIFNSLENNILKKVPDRNEDSLIIHSMDVTYHFLNSRDTFFKNEAAAHLLRNDLYTSVSEDMISVSNACGSYTTILARLLKDMGFTIRIVQMEVNKKYGGHIIMEAQTKKGWVVLDPLYNLYFKNYVGNMSSFKEVSSNWEFYKRFTPANYNQEYNYQDVQYTNWNKIPVIMPLFKRALNIIIGKTKADEVSLRTYFLSPGKFYCNLFSFLLIILTAYIILLLKGKSISLKNKKIIKENYSTKRSIPVFEIG